MNEERLRRIQEALREEKLDAWFLADFRGADPISLHILGLQGRPMVTRRWFYVIPAQGDPVRIYARLTVWAIAGVLALIYAFRRVELRG